MMTRILIALVALAVAGAPNAAFAQGTTTPAKPATTATPAKPAAKATPAKAAAGEDEDEPSSAEAKKACDGKWKTEKEKTGAKGWKAYFTFMSKCL